MWMTSCARSVGGGFREIWEKSVSWVPGSEEDSCDRDLGEARRICALRACWGERWKRRHRNIVLLSSLCRKTFKLKGNKKFRTWTKKSRVFFVFRDSYVISMLYMNILWTFHVHFTYSCMGMLHPYLVI